MMLKSCIAQINAHGRSQISAMTQSYHQQNEFVTIAHDGFIKIWNADTMKPVSSARIKCGYLTSLINYENGFLVGTGSGELVKFTNKLEKEWTKKVHLDCVNDIIETDTHLISVGSDGKAVVMTKPTLGVEKEIDFSVPLTKITRIGDQVYIAGNPSFKIDLNTFQVTKQRRGLQFIEHKGKILGCSEQKGMQILELEQNIDEIHCHFMLQFKNKLITISEKILGIVDFERSDEGDEELSYSIYRVPNLKRGYSIKAGFAYGDFILLAGEDGQVYKFQFCCE